MVLLMASACSQEDIPIKLGSSGSRDNNDNNNNIAITNNNLVGNNMYNNNIADIFTSQINYKAKHLDGFAACRKRVPLWLFLLELLEIDKDEAYICWTQEGEYEFHIKNPDELASIWGQIKENKTMSYSKLSRAVRYYYGKDILEKVQDKPFTYQFVLSHKTKNYLPEPQGNKQVPWKSIPIVEPITKTLTSKRKRNSRKDQRNQKELGNVVKDELVMPQANLVNPPKQIKLEVQDPGSPMSISETSYTDVTTQAFVPSALFFCEPVSQPGMAVQHATSTQPIVTSSEAAMLDCIRGSLCTKMEDGSIDFNLLATDTSVPDSSGGFFRPLGALPRNGAASCESLNRVQEYRIKSTVETRGYFQSLEGYCPSKTTSTLKSPAPLWTIDDDLDLIDSFLMDSSLHTII